MMIEQFCRTPLSRKQVDALEKEARRVAKSLGVSPDDIADTVEFPAKRDGSWTRGEFRVWCYVVRPDKVAMVERLRAAG